MRLRTPKFHTGLSQFSVFLLLGLVAFAAIVLFANPFRPASASGLGVSGNTQTTAGGSLITAPPSAQSGDADSFGFEGHHHHQESFGTAAVTSTSTTTSLSTSG